MIGLLTKSGKSILFIGFIFALGVFFFGFSTPARATNVIDQQQGGSSGFFAPTDVVGQTFVPSKSNFSGYGVIFEGTATPDCDISVQIYRGDYLLDSQVQLIATSSINSCPRNVYIQKLLPTPIVITPGQTHSLLFIENSATSTQKLIYGGGGDLYNYGYAFKNGVQQGTDLYFATYYDNAYNGGLTILSPINGYTYNVTELYLSGYATYGLNSIAIWLDELATGNTYLMKNSNSVAGEIYEWDLYAQNLVASSTYRLRYITSANGLVGSSTQTVYISNLATSTDQGLDMGIACPTIEATCEGDDTGALLGQLSCAVKRAGVWATCPDSQRMFEMRSAIEKVKTKFPIADYFAITNSVQSGLASTTVASSTTLGVPMIRKTATSTQYYIMPLLSSSSLPNTVGSSNANLVRTGFVYMIWVFAGAFVIFQLKGAISS